ncbi:MAG TPA: hypothetical protein VL022_04925 [Moheibacter sp.]|nr:hypothetical protein [Moheibacter sp.]
MDWKVIVLCLFLSGCVAKKKAVEVKKAEMATFEDRSETNVDLTKFRARESFEGFGTSEFAQLSSLFNWQFTGENETDEFKLKIDKTESGIELTAKGKGTANAETNSKFEVSRWQEEYTVKYDSLALAFTNYKSQTESKFKQFEKTKLIDKQSVGVPAGVYIVAAILGVVWILLAMFKRRLKLI